MTEAIIEVRDHSRPCEHGYLGGHWFEMRKGRWWQEPDCPGGQEIRLRRVGSDLWELIEDDETPE